MFFQILMMLKVISLTILTTTLFLLGKISQTIPGRFFSTLLNWQLPAQTAMNFLRSLWKSSKRAGIDGISSKILKVIVSVILKLLAHCINLSLTIGIGPKMAKNARVIAIFKSVDKNDYWAIIAQL